MSNQRLLELSNCVIEGDFEQRRLARQVELRQILVAHPDVANLYENIYAKVLVDTKEQKLECEARVTQLRSESLRRSPPPASQIAEGWIDKLGNFMDEARRRQMECHLIDAEDFYDSLTINSALKQSQRQAELQRTLIEHPELVEGFEANRARLTELLGPLREQRKRDLRAKK